MKKLIVALLFLATLNLPTFCQSPLLQKIDIQLSSGLLVRNWGEWRNFKDHNNMSYELLSSNNPWRFSINYHVNSKWELSLSGMTTYRENFENTYVDPNPIYPELTETNSLRPLSYDRTWGRVGANQIHYSMSVGYSLVDINRLRLKGFVGGGFSMVQYNQRDYDVYLISQGPAEKVGYARNGSLEDQLGHLKIACEANYRIFSFLHAVIGMEALQTFPGGRIEDVGFSQLYVGLSLGMNGAER
ncbi:MAG: hypothetical protein AAFY71_25900 [Bacteroidota bacterium]